MSLREFLGLGYYISPLDRFLHEFNQSHPNPSPSQKREIDKYRRIHDLRDGLVSPEKKDIWENF